MLMTIERDAGFLGRAPATMNAAAATVATRLHGRAQSLRARLRHPVNLRSRRGAGDMIWTILVVGLVAVVAWVERRKAKESVRSGQTDHYRSARPHGQRERAATMLSGFDWSTP